MEEVEERWVECGRWRRAIFKSVGMGVSNELRGVAFEVFRVLAHVAPPEGAETAQSRFCCLNSVAVHAVKDYVGGLAWWGSCGGTRLWRWRVQRVEGAVCDEVVWLLVWWWQWPAGVGESSSFALDGRAVGVLWVG